jgi:hypothetical protein
MTRLPRFHRATLTTPLVFTDRDVAILRVVAQHHFLRSSQIAALVGGSRQQVLRRLQRLYHHGHLDRPRCQLDYYHRGGSRELVYALTGRGGQQLTVLDGVSPGRLPPHAGDVKRLYLEHALLVSDVAVALELSPRGDVRLLPEHELELPARLGHSRQPFAWGVNVTPQLRIGLQPDKVFGLQASDAQPPAVFFLEADRGTMPVTRAGLSQSSFFRKLLAYQATWTQGVHRSRFGFPRFRVLTVTSSPERVRHLVAACQRLDRGHRLFLFTDRDSFLRQPDPFTAPLLNGKGETDCLLNIQ